jgi:hypothetical protein
MTCAWCHKENNLWSIPVRDEKTSREQRICLKCLAKAIMEARIDGL